MEPRDAAHSYHEEGEPETIHDPVEPLSDETVEKLRAQGIELPDWKPTVSAACGARSPLGHGDGCTLPAGHDGYHRASNGVDAQAWPQDTAYGQGLPPAGGWKLKMAEDPTEYSPEFQDEYRRLWHEAAADRDRLRAELDAVRDALLIGHYQDALDALEADRG